MSGEGGGLRARITGHVIRQILSGAWASREQVPSESRFMAQFGASRMTVHHALRDLTIRGYLVRRKGAGTYVGSPQSYVSRYPNQDIAQAIGARGGQHSARVVRQEQVTADAGMAGAFGCAAGDALFHAMIVHCEDDRPVELEDRLVSPAVLPEFLNLDLSRTTLFSSLMLSRPCREGSESICPVRCTVQEQTMLACDAGEPALAIVRRTGSPDGPVTWVRLLRIGAHARLEGSIACTIVEAAG
ncbi:UTRA domain-containing protein [Sphingobium aquiterrae]|uniref:UTRA domain-containing protein n=1 Tax=Sphingobium aquiterrae TaxID=2038656 RepID=UPI00301AEFEB